MPALPEALVLALALLASWLAREAAIDAPNASNGSALADDATPLDDAILYALV
jgi:hypothetical protein